MDEVSFGVLDFLKLCGSLALFIYGMTMMSDNIKLAAGQRLKSVLSKMTNNKFAGVGTGFAATALVQSSSATTVMLVSLVTAGVVSVEQSVGVIMGANIGTTVTGWLVGLLGFKVKIAAFSYPLMAIGLPIMFVRKGKYKSVGSFIFGFALLFFGLSEMKNAVPDLKNHPEVLSFLDIFTGLGYVSYLFFVLVGTLLTIAVQSSSAMMGITIVLCAQGVIPFEVATSMVLGENIGTTVTAYLASLVGDRNARQAAAVHFLFNVFGVVWMVTILPFFLPFIDLLNISLFGLATVFHENQALKGAAMTSALPLFHTVFNVLNTMVMIWFSGLLLKVSAVMVRK